jgi:hypothetical protein
MFQAKIKDSADFTAILEGLEQPASGADETEETWPAERYQAKSWLLQLLGSFSGRHASGAAAFSAYMDDEAELAEPAPKSEQQAIAEELGLGPDLTSADLQQIRREFAKKNHPDRCDDARRAEATRRMTIANMLIDRHLQLKKAVK